MPAKAASSIPERQIGPMSCGVLDHPLSRMMTTVGGEPPIIALDDLHHLANAFCALCLIDIQTTPMG
jgi:hypothetical protein